MPHIPYVDPDSITDPEIKAYLDRVCAANPCLPTDGPSGFGCRRRQTDCVFAQHRAMLDAEGFDPALLAEGEADKKPEFDQFRNREVAVQLRPQLVIRDVCVPNDRTGVSQREFFPFGEFVGIGEVEEIVQKIETEVASRWPQVRRLYMRPRRSSGPDQA